MPSGKRLDSVWISYPDCKSLLLFGPVADLHVGTRGILPDVRAGSSLLLYSRCLRHLDFLSSRSSLTFVQLGRSLTAVSGSHTRSGRSCVWPWPGSKWIDHSKFFPSLFSLRID